MPSPNVKLTILDGALGILPPSIDQAHLKLGVCNAGATNTVQAFADVTAMRTALGNGPLVEALASSLVTPTQGQAPNPIYAMRIATTAVGAAGSVTTTRVGTSTGTVVTTGSSPLDSYEVRVRIATAGVRGVGTYQLSYDGGLTYGAATTIPTGGTSADSATGVTLVFDTGTFDAGDLFSFATTEPQPTAAEIATALDAALASATEYSFVHLVGVAPFEMTSVTSAGTTPPAVTLTGTPNGFHDVRIEITTGGALATAVFRWSINGGSTWTAGVTTAASVVLTGTGLTANFAAGTYATNNVYTAHGANNFRTRLDTMSTKMAAAEAAYRYVRAIVDGPVGASDAVCTQSTATFVSARVGSVPSSVRLLSPVSNRRYLRPAAWSLVTRLAATEVHTHPGRVDNGPLADVLVNTRDERLTPGLDDARWGALRTIQGTAGTYVNRGRLFANAGSDFQYIMNGRLMDKACRIARAALTQFLNVDLRTNPSSSTVLAGLPGAPGTIDERDARRIESSVLAKLNDGLLATGNASACSVQLSRVDNILSTSTLKAKIRVQPKAYAEFIEAEIALFNPFTS